MCFVRISEQTATFALYSINWLVFITEVESVYSTVRTESFVFKGLKLLLREPVDNDCKYMYIGLYNTYGYVPGAHQEFFVGGEGGWNWSSM
jgi:hypothetical protein